MSNSYCTNCGAASCTQGAYCNNCGANVAEQKLWVQQHQQQQPIQRVQQYRKDDWMCSNGSCTNQKKW